MADNEEGEQTTSHGNEWEVVSLTASAYASAPGPDGVESIHEDKDKNTNEREAETCRALFMSGHFVFPPSEHENLPIEPDNVEMQKEEKEAQHGVTETVSEEGSLSEQKGEEKWNMTGLNVPEVLQSIYDDKGNRLSTHGPDFDENNALQGLNVACTEPDMYNSAKFSSFCDAKTMGGSIYGESKVSSSLANPAEASFDSSDESHSEDKSDGPELPAGAWWKRQVASLCAHATETSAFWSIFFATAVMGLVILGNRWQHERWQVLQLRWHASINAEKSGRMLAPLSRLKDKFVGGCPRTSYIKNAVATER